jgi:methylated-DNA-[protein]-cysteine S-methyltransferase
MKKTLTEQSFVCFFSSIFGPVAILWYVYKGLPKIFRIFLSNAEISSTHLVKAAFPRSVESSCTEIDIVVSQIEAFLNGEDISFSLEITRLNVCSKFQQKVLRAEKGIPRGQVSTYQRIAKHVGKPSGARAVGTALANNPFPLLIPCHRAIRSDRTLGGYQGGLKMKQRLLEMEGIFLNDRGRVITERMFY